ncbi:MAG: CBS domain-containing protein [Chloroflexi bacterium]|nr:CBS domain-containing protein [Chloroflexota bacterium]
MLVREVMTPDPLTVQPDDTLRTAQERMSECACRRLPVVDENGRLVGIITDRDVRLALNSPLVLRERWQDDMLINQTTVEVCMTPDPVVVAPDSPLQDAADMLLQRKISGLPVVDGDRLVGIITVTDLLGALRDLLRRE